MFELGKALSCPICTLLFVRPVTLQCGHSCCEECARKQRDVAAATDDASVGRAAKTREMRCPECRALVLDADRLTIDTRLERLVSTYRTSIHPPVYDPERKERVELSQVSSVSTLAQAFKTAHSIAASTPPNSALLTTTSTTTTTTTPSGDDSSAKTPATVNVAEPTVSSATSSTTASSAPTAPLELPSTSTPPTVKVVHHAPALTSSASSSSSNNNEPSSVVVTNDDFKKKKKKTATNLPPPPNFDAVSPPHVSTTASSSATSSSSAAAITTTTTTSKTTSMPPPDEVPSKPNASVTSTSEFRVGKVVTVKRRMGPNENKPGGVAMIKSVNPDGTLNVYYVVHGTREKNVPVHLCVLGRHSEDDESLWGDSAIVASERQPPPSSSSSSTTTTAATLEKPSLPSLPQPALTPVTSSTSSLVAANDAGGTTKRRSSFVSPIDTAPISSPSKRSRSGRATRNSSSETAATQSTSTPIVLLRTFGKASNEEKAAEREMLARAKKELGGMTVCEERALDENLATVTHCLVSCESGGNSELVAAARTMKYMICLSAGKLLVDKSWIERSLLEKRWLPCDPFLVCTDAASREKGLASGGPQRAQGAVAVGTPLFLDARFFFLGPFANKVTREDLSLLAHNCGAALSRTIGPETSVVVVDDEAGARAARDDPRTKAEFTALLALLPGGKIEVVRLAWFFNCVSSYTKLDTVPYRVDLASL